MFGGGAGGTSTHCRCRSGSPVVTACVRRFRRGAHAGEAPMAAAESLEVLRALAKTRSPALIRHAGGCPRVAASARRMRLGFIPALGTLHSRCPGRAARPVPCHPRWAVSQVRHGRTSHLARGQESNQHPHPRSGRHYDGQVRTLLVLVQARCGSDRVLPPHRQWPRAPRGPAPPSRRAL